MTLTILSEKVECLAHFGGLLDAGGDFFEKPYMSRNRPLMVAILVSGLKA